MELMRTNQFWVSIYGSFISDFNFKYNNLIEIKEKEKRIPQIMKPWLVKSKMESSFLVKLFLMNSQKQEGDSCWSTAQTKVGSRIEQTVFDIEVSH